MSGDFAKAGLIAIVGMVAGVLFGSTAIRDSVFKDCEALGGWRMSGKAIVCSVKVLEPARP